MELKVSIKKIRGINHAEVVLPIEKGLYAIAGENGSGKSTIVACIASAFFNFPKEQFFGETNTDSAITFTINDMVFQLDKSTGGWHKQHISGPNEYDQHLKGFYEGSLNYGNRFRDVSFWNIPQHNKLVSYQESAQPVSQEICRLFGKILHDKENYYDGLFRFRNRKVCKGDIFFYQKGNCVVDQFHMSTGENLLLSILNNIHSQRQKREANLQNPCVMILDEIEMGLHPSAMQRLIAYLYEVAEKYNYAIYLSTQSVEILNSLAATQIFYVERSFRENSADINVIHPCYPAKATRNIYKQIGFDRVILVEDDLARAYVDCILREERLKTNRLILILPCGGYSNVVDFTVEAFRYQLLGNKDTISVVFDRDVEKEAKSYMNHTGLMPDVSYHFLPMPSLEKYIYKNIVIEPDDELINNLNDYIFQPIDVRELATQYRGDIHKNNDNNGKWFYAKYIEPALQKMHKERSLLIEEIVKYLTLKRDANHDNLVNFLKDRMQ